MVEQSKPFIYLLVGLASIFIIISGVQNLAFILNPILLSLVITIALIPVPGWFARRGVPGWLSLVLTFVIVLGFIGLVLLLVFFGLARLAEVLPSLQTSVAANGDELLNMPNTILGYHLGEVREVVTAFLTSERLTGLATRSLSVLFTTVSQAFLVMLIFAFMLSAALSLPSSARLGLTAESPLVQQAAALTENVRRYVTLTTSLNLVAAIGNTILLLLLGVGPAVLWGLLSWFMGYIPAVGFWVAMLPPLALAFVEHGFTGALVVFIGYTLINGTVENLVKPRRMGRGLKISPVVVVISLFIWGWLLGIVGAILSTPLTLLILSVLELFEGTRWIAMLLRTTGTGEESAVREHEEALGRVRGLWDRGVTAVRNATRL
ncbi:MAG: AI-2E family transporter [Candidatus Promineofilum sp.]|nr:AI-2E family transporter [Promineifilum sp.]